MSVLLSYLTNKDSYISLHVDSRISLIALSMRIRCDSKRHLVPFKSQSNAVTRNLFRGEGGVASRRFRTFPFLPLVPFF